MNSRMFLLWIALLVLLTVVFMTTFVYIEDLTTLQAFLLGVEGSIICAILANLLDMFSGE